MPSPLAILIGPAAGGGWRVSTQDDLLGGVFVSRKAAMAFARTEMLWTKRRSVIVDVRPEQPNPG